MLNFARGQGIVVKSVRLMLHDEVADAPKRVNRIHVTAELEGNYTDSEWERLIRVASHCKIHNSLATGVDVALELRKAAAR